MKNMFRNIILLLVCGVFGDTGEGKTETVMEGDSLTLHTDLTELQTHDLILWRFGEAGSQKLLVQMKENKVTYVEYVDGRFRDRLQISDTQSGSLTIKNMRLKHSGLYEAEISTSSRTTYKTFNVTVKESAVTDAGTDEVSESVMEGESVTLLNDIQTQTDDLILWRFGSEGVLIAKHDKEDNKISLYDDDGRFRDRLQVDDQTGSLTITNSRISDSGLYKLKIISSIRETKYKIFNVIVRDAGLSSGAVAGIIISVLLVIAAAAVGVIFYRRMSELKKLRENMKIVSAMKGRPVTLSSGVTDIQSDDVIQWRFRETLIAELKGKEKKISTDDKDVQRFRGRLILNDQTGDLTIRDIRHEDAGLYKQKIITRRGTSESLIYVIVSENMRTVTVKKGHPLTLSSGVTHIQSDDVIEWRFRETLIAEINSKEKISTDDKDVQRFRGRLKLNDQTGDLMISDIRPEHAGRYKLKTITSRGTSESLINVIVSDKAPERAKPKEQKSANDSAAPLMEAKASV